MTGKGVEENQKKETEGSKTPFSVRFAIFILLVMSLALLPTTIVFFVCMIPTLVAAIVDSHPKKTAWLTVGAMNLAGTVPAWFNLWDMGHTIPAAFQLIFQPVTILISYGGATIGWTIYSRVTPFVASIILGKNEWRLREIDRRQKELVKKWGAEVASS